MTNSNKWKKCPKCSGFIPTNWAKHDKCGWIESEKVIESVSYSHAVDSQGNKVEFSAKQADIDVRHKLMIMSYAKDLCVAKVVKIDDFEKLVERLCKCLTK